jgi:hypothetical protein
LKIPKLTLWQKLMLIARLSLTLVAIAFIIGTAQKIQVLIEAGGV